MRAIEILFPFSLPGMNEIIAMAKQQLRGRGTKGQRQSFYSITKANLTGACSVIIDTALRAQGVGKPIQTPVNLEFRWEITKRRDPDNAACGCKFIVDGLVWAGALANDGFKEVHTIVHTFAAVPKHAQRVWMKITFPKTGKRMKITFPKKGK